MRSPFGWSYPAGCSGPPDDYEPYEELFRCDCGAFLPKQEAGTKEFEDAEECDGNVKSYDGELFALCGLSDAKHEPHKVIYNGGTLLLFNCKRCGAEGVERGY